MSATFPSEGSDLLPLEGVCSSVGLFASGLFASELSSSLSPLAGWLSLNEMRLRVICPRISMDDVGIAILNLPMT